MEIREENTGLFQQNIHYPEELIISEDRTKQADAQNSKDLKDIKHQRERLKSVNKVYVQLEEQMWNWHYKYMIIKTNCAI